MFQVWETLQSHSPMPQKYLHLLFWEGDYFYEQSLVATGDEGDKEEHVMVCQVLDLLGERGSWMKNLFTFRCSYPCHQKYNL